MAYFPVDMIRSIRNKLLQESDIYVLPDYPHSTAEVRQGWLDYRQRLRDLTNDLELSEDGKSAKTLSVPWPTKPIV